MKDKTTTIGIKERTRQRLRHVCDFILHVPDYDKGINAVLDALGHPTWEEIQRSAVEKIVDEKAQASEVA